MEYIAKWLFASALFALLIVGFAVGTPFENGDESYSPEEMNYVGIPPDYNNGADPEDNTSIDAAIAKTRSMTELYLSLGVLVFGLFLVLFTGFVAFKRGSGWDQETSKLFAVAVIVTAGLFLITAGYSDQQIAPMFALLGTIVGYLLGKSQPGKEGPEKGG